MTSPGNEFIADFHSSCAGCGEDIVPDDIVHSGEDGYLCEECAHG